MMTGFYHRVDDKLFGDYNIMLFDKKGKFKQLNVWQTFLFFAVIGLKPLDSSHYGTFVNHPPPPLIPLYIICIQWPRC